MHEAIPPRLSCSDVTCHITHTNLPTVRKDQGTVTADILPSGPSHHHPQTPPDRRRRRACPCLAYPITDLTACPHPLFHVPPHRRLRSHPSRTWPNVVSSPPDLPTTASRSPLTGSRHLIEPGARDKIRNASHLPFSVTENVKSSQGKKTGSAKPTVHGIESRLVPPPPPHHADSSSRPSGKNQAKKTRDGQRAAGAAVVCLISGCRR